ncbi:MAG TPA: hypothetical protein ENJ76_00090 [Oceanithermus sp.]|nr:hypothetical protein [Oceanithermus sp.]
MPVFLLDSVTEGGEEQTGQVVVTGSHGGVSAARYALRYRPLLVVFNDAGIGKDEAGVAGLGILEEAGLAAVAVAHTSARIGEARDTWESGVISRANAPAQALGLEPGQKLREAIRSLRFPERR